ncbi:MAG: universal stress protein [Chloroflexi bacterium]|nr:universal stress protein [Chloroflexota bacterium]
MYNSIVVPLDGSSFSEHALPSACALATRTGATLWLLHVHALSASPIYVEGLPVIDEKLISQSRAHAFAYLQQVQTRLLAAQPQLNIAIKAIDRAIESIVQEPLGAFLATYIAATNPDLVVMTTHGRGGLARAWLGSVADTLVRLSHVPILLVQPTEAAVDFGQAPPVKHILIALDGSTFAEQILEPTLTLGRLLGAECTLLQVVEPLFPVYNAVAHTQELDAAGVQIAQRYLADIVQRFHREGLSVTTHVALAEQPAAAILAYAQRHAVDLVALATHGRSGLPRLWLGSVGDKVLRGATMPVLIYRPQVEAAFA